MAESFKGVVAVDLGLRLVVAGFPATRNEMMS